MANEFLPFALDTGANVMTQAAYAALAARSTGFTAGTARSLELNKVWRQSSFVAYCLTKFMEDVSGDSVLDNGDSAAFITTLAKAILAAIPAATTSVDGKVRIASTAEAQAGTDDTKAVTPLKVKQAFDAFGIPQATATVMGGGKTAAASDALVGSSATLLMTPAAFSGAAASESFRGTIKRATQALVNALANDTDAVTPLKLGSGFAVSKTSNGYIKLPDWLGGLVIQWGVVTSLAAEATTTVTFPLTFPVAIRGGLASINRATAITGGVSNAYFSPLSTSQATIVNDGSSGATAEIFWVAIGN